MEHIDQLIGSRLRESRELRTKSLTEVASSLGIEPVALQRMEAGEERVSAEHMMLLCECLEIKPADIFEHLPVGRPDDPDTKAAQA